MTHSLCIIDDAIPASNNPEFIDDTKLLGKSVLRFLLANAEWPDDNVKALVSRLSDDGDNWYMTAFRNPSFFFNHIENNILTPEIIIFDWDYDGRSDASEEYLLDLLKATYSIIFIYTNADTEGAITATIESDKFADFSHRLSLIRKDNANSADELLTAANEKYKSNFSYRFGKELKMNACKALDEVLIEMSKLSPEDFIRLFGAKIGNKYSIQTLDLVSIISEKFKHQLLKQEFENETESVATAELDQALVKKIWAYRLYHHPVDDVVRKGDIIRTSKSNGDRLALVLSSDCHMDQFWNKNFGFVCLAPLHRLTPGSDTIKRIFGGNKPGKLKNFRLTSLTNPTAIEGITILPGIRDTNDNYWDYLLNAKEVFNVQIRLPEQQNIERLPLMYKYWRGYTGKNRIRISEPFLSPLIQFIMEHVTGYGCPDFPKPLQDQITKSFEDART